MQTLTEHVQTRRTAETARIRVCAAFRIMHTDKSTDDKTNECSAFKYLI